MSLAHLSDPHQEREHHYLRQSLAQIKLALSHHEMPPEGHAFYGMLSAAAEYFACKLPHHVAQEEHDLYPALAEVGQKELEALKAEHQRLFADSQAFFDAVGALTFSAHAAVWQQVQLTACNLERTLNGHLAHEEAVIHQAMRTAARSGHQGA